MPERPNFNPEELEEVTEYQMKLVCTGLSLQEGGKNLWTGDELAQALAEDGNPQEPESVPEELVVLWVKGFVDSGRAQEDETLYHRVNGYGKRLRDMQGINSPLAESA